MATIDNLTTAQTNQIQQFADRVFGAGTYNRVNFGNLAAMFAGAANGTTGNLNARDKRTATRLRGLITAASE